MEGIPGSIIGEGVTFFLIAVFISFALVLAYIEDKITRKRDKCGRLCNDLKAKELYDKSHSTDSYLSLKGQ